MWSLIYLVLQMCGFDPSLSVGSVMNHGPDDSWLSLDLMTEILTCTLNQKFWKWVTSSKGHKKTMQVLQKAWTNINEAQCIRFQERLSLLKPSVHVHPSTHPSGAKHCCSTFKLVSLIVFLLITSDFRILFSF